MSENVENELSWRRSSLCESSGCVEIALASNNVYMRDSKADAGDLSLAFSTASWRSFLEGVRAGEFEAH